MSTRQKIAGVFLGLGLVIAYLGVAAIEAGEIDSNIAFLISLGGLGLSALAFPISGDLHKDDDIDDD